MVDFRRMILLVSILNLVLLCTALRTAIGGLGQQEWLQATAEGQAPELVASYDFPIRYITIDGNDALLSIQGEIQIVDVSSGAPKRLGSYPAKIDGRTAVKGTLAYVLGGSGLGGRVEVFDFSDPAKPVSVAYVDATAPSHIVIAGNYAFVTQRNANGLIVLDISSSQPVLVAGPLSIVDDGRGLAVSGSGKYLYVTSLSATLTIIDVSDPLQPVVVSSIGTGEPTDVAVAAGYAYVTVRSPNTNAAASVQVIDISTPTAPRLSGTFEFIHDKSGLSAATSIVVQEDTAYVAVNAGVVILDIVGGSLTRKAVYGTPSSVPPPCCFGCLCAPPFITTDLAVSGNYMYVADGFSMQVLDTSQLSAAEPQNVLGGGVGIAAAVAIGAISALAVVFVFLGSLGVAVWCIVRGTREKT